MQVPSFTWAHQRLHWGHQTLAWSLTSPPQGPPPPRIVLYVYVLSILTMMVWIVHRHNNDDLNLVNPDVKPPDVHLCILTPRICHLKLPNKLLMIMMMMVMMMTMIMISRSWWSIYQIPGQHVNYPIQSWLKIIRFKKYRQDCKLDVKVVFPPNCFRIDMGPASTNFD